MINTTGMAFPKPGSVKQEPEVIHVFPDGRERLNILTPAGREEYKRRLKVAWTQQNGLCGLCGKPVSLSEATVDHVVPRGSGGGTRDDRQENLRAAHWVCNSERGSKRKGYYEQ